MPDDNRTRVDISTISVRPAASGSVSFGDPVVLHDTSRMKITMVPFFVPHSDRTELNIKLQCYKKDKLGWFMLEDRSLSLNEDALRALLRELQTHLAVAAGSSNGGYIALRLTGPQPDLGDADPVQVAQALLGVLSRPDVASHVHGMELTAELASAFKGSIRLREMREAVSTLRNYLEEGITDEQVYQRWCEQHSWAFGNAYVMRDEVRNISAGDRLDLLLPTVLTGYRDIIELKRPDMSVLLYDASHRNFYWSADVSKGLGQIHRYLDVLSEAAANGLRDHPEVVAYKPRAVLVIGRLPADRPEIAQALHGLNSRLHGITVMTYDQLLAQGERLVQVVGAELHGVPASTDPEMADDEGW